MNLLQSLGKQSKASLVAITFAILAVVGVADYLTGYEVLFTTFYLIAVALATWWVNRWFGVLISFLSTVVTLTSDLAAGAPFSHPLIPLWNAGVTLAFYLAVVWLLGNLRSLHNDLEERVRDRTAALRTEMAEKQRLEHEILDISERERRAIGRDLHDSLGQHLTATALAGQVLEEKLAARELPEAVDARKVVDLVESGVELTRSLARGLHPIQISADGFMESLGELATVVSDRFKVTCQFECDQPVAMQDGTMATHLYRIAQEAVTNAIKHGRAHHITIRLSRNGTATHLTITDDGAGLSDKALQSDGLGLRIMAHRASILGAEFKVAPGTDEGTVVTCIVP